LSYKKKKKTNYIDGSKNRNRKLPIIYDVYYLVLIEWKSKIIRKTLQLKYQTQHLRVLYIAVVFFFFYLSIPYKKGKEQYKNNKTNILQYVVQYKRGRKCINNKRRKNKKTHIIHGKVIKSLEYQLQRTGHSKKRIEPRIYLTTLTFLCYVDFVDR
jgi:hypothetical protein